MIRFLMVATLVAVDANFVFNGQAPAPDGWGADTSGTNQFFVFGPPSLRPAQQYGATQNTVVPYSYSGDCEVNVHAVSMQFPYTPGTALDSGPIQPCVVGGPSCQLTFPYAVGIGSTFGYNIFVSPTADCSISVLSIGTYNYVAAGGSADPHLSLAYGGMADFRGINNTFFSMLSSPGINAVFKTTDAVFMIKHSRRVEGSFMTELAVNVMSGTEMFTVRTVAEKETGFYVANAKNEVISRNDKWSTITGDGVVVEQLMLTTSIRAHGWEVNATRKPVYNHVSGPNWRFDFTLRPLADESKWTCHPHGIIGQSFDGTGIGLLGKMDDYEEKNVKTSAMAEGVIEGTAADYIVKPESPTFKYSRFNANDETACKPRDAMTLSGSKIRGSNNMAAGASD